MNETNHLIIKDNTFQTILSAVDKMVNLVRTTFGPFGSKIIIDKLIYRMVVDDGVQVARDFELDDPAENAVIKIIRETAVKTNDRVGDGTTNSLILLQSILYGLSRRVRFHARNVVAELKKALEEAKDFIKKSAREVKTREDLFKVALISFDNREVAEIIADTYHKIGKDGTITIEKSQTMETSVEMTDGVKINSGYASPYMVTNPQRMEAEFENPHILLTDYRLTENSDILHIMNKMAQAGARNLVVIADNVEQHALATLVVNLPQVINSETKKNGTFQSIAVPIPRGEDNSVFLEDLALITGAKVFSVNKGNKLETATVEDLGRAGKFICRRDESIIVSPQGNKTDIAINIASLRVAVKDEKDESIKRQLQRRLATLTNTLAVIRVGAPTDNEQKALKYKVEDAVNAVKSAFNHGVVCGAGLALARTKTSSPLLNEALQRPHQQLKENMGVDQDYQLGPDEAVNMVTGETGDFMDVGVADPADVLIAGLESAVSTASLLITSSGMIVEYEKPSSG